MGNGLSAGQAGLTANEVDLGGVTATTWAYGGRIPGKELRAKAGEVLRIHVENALPVETSVHWHGIRLHKCLPLVYPGRKFMQNVF